MTGNTARPHPSIPARPSSVEKAIDVLFCFDLKHPQLCLVDISQRLGLHKSTVHRLLSLLKKKGLVVANASSQLYSLGPALVELAWVVLRQQDLRALSRLPMEDLRRATNETVSLHIRMADRCVCGRTGAGVADAIADPDHPRDDHRRGGLTGRLRRHPRAWLCYEHRRALAVGGSCGGADFRPARLASRGPQREWADAAPRCRRTQGVGGQDSKVAQQISTTLGYTPA